MNARDELADEIAGHPVGSGYYSISVGMSEAREIADNIIAAGYQKPRIVTTSDEVAALAISSVLYARDGGIYTALDHLGWRKQGSVLAVADIDIPLPATVLFAATE